MVFYINVTPLQVFSCWETKPSICLHLPSHDIFVLLAFRTWAWTKSYPNQKIANSGSLIWRSTVSVPWPSKSAPPVWRDSTLKSGEQIDMSDWSDGLEVYFCAFWEESTGRLDHKRDYRNHLGFESSNLWYPSKISMLDNHLELYGCSQK